MRTKIAVLAALGVLGLGPTAAFAATISVTTTSDENSSSPANAVCALREALIAANTNAAVGGCPAGSPGADTVVAPAGTYALTIAGVGEDASQTGDLDITESATIQGAGIASTIIDGGALDRVIHVAASSAPATITALTIQNGTEGIVNDAWSAGSTIVSIVTVQSNAGVGVLTRGALTLNSSTIRNNGKGGVWIDCCSGSGTLTDVTVENNYVASSPGGAVFAWGPMTMDRSRIRNNTGAAGTAGVVTISTLSTIKDTTIENNTQYGFVGGCYGISCYSNGLTMDRSTVSGNGTGGMWLLATATNLTNSTISGNTGFGIQTYSSSINAHHVTVTGNTGLAIDNQPYIYSPSHHRLSNTIVSGACATLPPNTTTSLGGNLESPGNTCNLVALGDQVAVPSPGLGALAFNSGPTKTHLPSATSAALDMGLGSVACPPTDQRNIARPYGPACDVGAVERSPSGCREGIESATLAPLALVLVRRRRRRGSLVPAWRLRSSAQG